MTQDRTTDESGRDQIYVQAIPASGAKYQISTSGGSVPRWRQDGQELFYVSPDRKLMAVPIIDGATLQVGTAEELFTSPGMTSFAPSRDGQSFLVEIPDSDNAAAVPPITVVTNWQAGLGK